MSLANQFSLAASIVLAAGMIFLGLWVSGRIERGVVQNTANGAALYINSFVEPHVLKLASGAALDAQEVQSLDSLLKDTPLGRKVTSIKIWLPDGTIAYSNNRQLVGRKFPVTDRLARAMTGRTSAAIENEPDEENLQDRTPGSSLIEIYSPLLTGTPPRVFAVAEFYQIADDLNAELHRARNESLLAVAFTTLAMLSVLYLIVRGGSQLIVQQEERLRGRLCQISETLAENQRLSQAVEEAHQRLLTTNDMTLRRLGAELHDGPAQLISLALLRLDALRPRDGAENPTLRDDFERVHTALVEALTEIRDLSAGVTLPQLETISTSAVLQLVARNHERRSGTSVAVNIDPLPSDLPMPLKACLYRIAQEGLNNAYRHASGSGQALRGSFRNGTLELEISDTGHGLTKEPRPGVRLGLAGMRDRVTSMGGTFHVTSHPGQGTRLRARFEIAKLKTPMVEKQAP